MFVFIIIFKAKTEAKSTNPPPISKNQQHRRTEGRRYGILLSILKYSHEFEFIALLNLYKRICVKLHGKLHVRCSFFHNIRGHVWGQGLWTLASRPRIHP